jgi:thiol-disulfide isomerase/thioredoxin
LLVRDVAKDFAGRVTVSVEEYGSSEMARRFGVRRYPVVFVDDVLFARPKDFGFGGAADVSGGLYVPWLDPANQRRFKDDLRRAVTRRLAGESVAGHNLADVAADGDSGDGPSTLPALTLTDIDGRAIAPSSLAGHPVVVEMWATWCPPCRSTLAWLDTLQKRRRGRLTVVAVAVDSRADDVRKMAAALKPAYRIVMGSPDVITAFGAVAAVPKVLIFDTVGRRTAVVYGAPPDLHQQLETALAKAER